MPGGGAQNTTKCSGHDNGRRGGGRSLVDLGADSRGTDALLLPIFLVKTRMMEEKQRLDAVEFR